MLNALFLTPEEYAVAREALKVYAEVEYKNESLSISQKVELASTISMALSKIRLQSERNADKQ